MSAYVAEALEEKVRPDDLASLLDEMLAATGGPLTAADQETADRALGGDRCGAGRWRPLRLRAK